jgi:hypothetical protein
VIKLSILRKRYEQNSVIKKTLSGKYSKKKELYDTKKLTFMGFFYFKNDEKNIRIL